MAKSLRSKRMRKMRAIKRERYAVKELKQLKSILETAEKKDIDMSDICTVLPKGSFSQIAKTEKSEDVKDPIAESSILTKTEKSGDAEDPIAESSSAMEVDKKTPKYHPKYLTNEHGNYPVWMNQRKIQKHKKRLGRKAGKKNNKKR